MFVSVLVFRLEKLNSVETKNRHGEQISSDILQTTNRQAYHKINHLNNDFDVSDQWQLFQYINAL